MPLESAAAFTMANNGARMRSPRYAASNWFGSVAEYERMRFLRAIADLERGGLLETWKRCGRRLSNFKLSDAGTELVEKTFLKTEADVATTSDAPRAKEPKS
jgi:hypothetical protein